MQEETDPFGRYLTARSEYLAPPLSASRLSLREVWSAAERLSGDRGDIRLFGLPTLGWWAIGVGILGRSAIEATRDPQARFLAEAVTTTLRENGHEITDVIDPFVGSGNVLYHFVKATGATNGTGIELDSTISVLTQRNFEALRRWRRLRGARVSIHHGDWCRTAEFLTNRPTLIVLSPPWGDAFDLEGLDLRATEPPIGHLLARLAQIEGDGPVFVAVMTFPKIVRQSLDEIVAAYATLPTLRPREAGVASRIDYLLLRLR